MTSSRLILSILAATRAATRAANADAVFLAPDLTYETGLTIHLDPFTVVLRHRPGHTRGDTVLWIPAAKVLANGDLLDDLPYVGHGFPPEKGPRFSPGAGAARLGRCP